MAISENLKLQIEGNSTRMHEPINLQLKNTTNVQISMYDRRSSENTVLQYHDLSTYTHVVVPVDDER